MSSGVTWGMRLGAYILSKTEEYTATCPSCDGDGRGRTIYTSVGPMGSTWDGKCSRCKGRGTITKRRWKQG
jgi:DnaJ-class molecular chaperone